MYREYRVLWRILYQSEESEEGQWKLYGGESGLYACELGIGTQNSPDAIPGFLSSMAKDVTLKILQFVSLSSSGVIVSIDTPTSTKGIVGMGPITTFAANTCLGGIILLYSFRYRWK